MPNYLNYLLEHSLCRRVVYIDRQLILSLEQNEQKDAQQEHNRKNNPLPHRCQPTDGPLRNVRHTDRNLNINTTTWLYASERQKPPFLM